MAAIVKIDVPRLLEELNRAGVPDEDIKAYCELKSRGTLYSWHDGSKRPSLLPGLRLLVLHLKHCPNLSPLRTVFVAESRVSLQGERNGHDPG